MVGRTKSLKKIEAEFFETDGGSKPVRDFLLSLDRMDRRQIGADPETIEMNWPIGMPLCRPVQGIWECRSTIKNGKVEARIMFGIHGRKMILLRGYEKRPSNQAREINNALLAWSDYQARHSKDKRSGKTKS